jgi:chromosomal replication initiator protein
MNDIEFNKWIAFVEKIFGIKQGNLVSRKRNRELVQVRHVCYYLLKDKGLIYTKIGKLFNRDHSTIIHGKELAEEVILPNKEININKVNMVDEHLKYLIGRW